MGDAVNADEPMQVMFAYRINNMLALVCRVIQMGIAPVATLTLSKGIRQTKR